MRTAPCRRSPLGNIELSLARKKKKKKKKQADTRDLGEEERETERPREIVGSGSCEDGD